MYTDDVTLNADIVLGTLYAAKKYMVPQLSHKCVEYLETQIDASNVCMILSQRHLLEDDGIILTKCLDIVDKHSIQALESDSFTEIDNRTLVTILERDQLIVKETLVYEAAIHWAKAECTRQELEITGGNMRKVLDSALYQIRFPTMTLDEFVEGPVCSGILSDQEAVQVFSSFSSRSKMSDMKFMTEQRAYVKIRSSCRFNTILTRPSHWNCNGNAIDAVSFKVDKPILLLGYGLFGCKDRAADYKVTMELQCDNGSLAKTDTSFHSNGLKYIYSVYFEKPVQVENNVCYTALVTLKGPISYYGESGNRVVASDHVSITFIPASTIAIISNGTNDTKGQIPSLIYCI